MNAMRMLIKYRRCASDGFQKKCDEKLPRRLPRRSSSKLQEGPPKRQQSVQVLVAWHQPKPLKTSSQPTAPNPPNLRPCPISRLVTWSLRTHSYYYETSSYRVSLLTLSNVVIPGAWLLS